VDRGRLLKRLRLWDQRDAPYSRLNGGERQRLALALALLNDPQVVLLDEPSADLDPQARGEIHELIEDLRRERRTILLASGSIGEAGKLCDRVAILDQGRIVAMGTPGELQERATADSAIEMECASPLAASALPRWVGAEKTEVDSGRTRVTVTSSRPARTMVEMMKWAEEQGIELVDIRLRRPSLEDAYRELTGKSPRE
jgi:ABC-2 type transport system ATP-binding protein